MTAGNATVGGALVYAWTLLKTNWRALWGVLALTSLSWVIYFVGDLLGQWEVGLAGVIAITVTSLMAYGALYRLAFADRHPGDPDFVTAHHGLQWRTAEWRMLLSSLLVGLFVGFMLILATLVALAVLSGVLQAKTVPMRMGMTAPQLEAALGPTGFSLVVLAGVAIILLGVYLSARLSLALPATVDAKAVRVLQTWKHTRRVFWPLLSANVLVQIPVSVISGAFAGALLGGGGSDLRAAPPEALLAAALILGAPIGALVLPLSAGAAAYFHRLSSADAKPHAPPPPVAQ